MEGLSERLSGLHKSQAIEVYRDMLSSIRTQSHASGSRLPNERELAEQYSVTRNTIRNVLSMLQSQGLVERRIGSGTYLKENAHAMLAENKPVASYHAEVPSFVEILEGRLLFEPDMVGLAAERANEADFAAMRAQISHMRLAKEWIEFKEHLYGVHLAMYKATKNRFLIQIFENIVSDRRAVEYDGGKHAHAPVGESIREQTIKELEMILDAIFERDSKLATKRSRDYLMRTLSSVAVYA